MHRTDPNLFLAVDGTSFSAPIVAAAAVWVRTVRPMHVTQLFDLLRWSARDIAEQGWFDERTGYGLLDVPRALGAALPPIDPREPNDDVDQVAANGIFVEASPPVNTPTASTLRAHIAISEAANTGDANYTLTVRTYRAR